MQSVELHEFLQMRSYMVFSPYNYIFFPHHSDHKFIRITWFLTPVDIHNYVERIHALWVGTVQKCCIKTPFVRSFSKEMFRKGRLVFLVLSLCCQAPAIRHRPLCTRPLFVARTDAKGCTALKTWWRGWVAAGNAHVRWSLLSNASSAGTFREKFLLVHKGPRL